MDATACNYNPLATTNNPDEPCILAPEGYDCLGQCLDSDGDGIKDWYEYYHFGDLSQGPQDDPDGDSFSNVRESALGQEATIADRVEDGGISSRASTGFLYMVLGNRTPYGVAISQNEFFEREPAGLTVGRLLPLDYDDPNQADAYDYALVSTGGANDNANFSISGDLLKTKVPMDIASYTVRVLFVCLLLCLFVCLFACVFV